MADVKDIDDEMVKDWSLKFSSVGVVLLGAGPPCQGVSGLNADRRGALRDHRSCLYHHVPVVEGLCRKHFTWAQIHKVVENVASMDYKDCELMNEAYEELPWYIDAGGVSLARRPRLYWISWELEEDPGAEVLWGSSGQLPIQGEVKLIAAVDPPKYLEPGWSAPEQKLPTFTTSRPSSTPHRKPAGLSTCQDHERGRWAADLHRFPPYQYRDSNCLSNARGEHRPPSVLEREAILGFPIGYKTMHEKILA